MICWETLALEGKEALGSRVGLRLCHQARFADPRFAGKQDNLPLAAFRSIDERVEGSEFGGATNQDRATDWGTEERFHSVCHLLTNVFTPSFYPLMYLSFSLTCSRLT